MRAGQQFPNTGDAALGRVVGAGFAQLGEKTDEIEALVHWQHIHETRGH